MHEGEYHRRPPAAVRRPSDDMLARVVCRSSSLATRTRSQLTQKLTQKPRLLCVCRSSSLATRPPSLHPSLHRPPPPTEAPPGSLGIMEQIQSEISGASANPAKLYGFVGACCNWFLGLSAVYDAANKGPEVISLKMTCVMLCYSTLFARWAGWAVAPRNYILAGSHMFNVVAQCNQLRRCLEYKVANGGEEAKAEVTEMATKAAIGAGVVTVAVLSADKLKAVVAPMGPAYLSSAGGPFTIHPWPPMTKLMISGASMLEYAATHRTRTQTCRIHPPLQHARHTPMISIL